MMNRPRVFLAAAIAAVAVALTPAAAASADEPLLSIDAAPVVVQVPAPGHSTEWSLTATNSSSHPVAVSALVIDAAGDVLSGAHPLELAVTGPNEVQLDLPSAGHSSAATPLRTVKPGETISLHGRASLPYAAGDEYQGRSGGLTVRLIGEDLGGAPAAGGLAHTGLSIVGLGVLAAGLLIAGILLALARRRRRGSEPSGSADDLTLSSTLDSTLDSPQVTR